MRAAAAAVLHWFDVAAPAVRLRQQIMTVRLPNRLSDSLLYSAVTQQHEEDAIEKKRQRACCSFNGDGGLAAAVVVKV